MTCVQCTQCATVRRRTDHLHCRTAQVAKLKHVNRQESEDLAKAFMSPPFINQMIEFTAAKNKTQANMVFKFLRLSRPVRPHSSISSPCSSLSSVRHTEIGGCRCGLEWPGFHDQSSMSGCTLLEYVARLPLIWKAAGGAMRSGQGGCPRLECASVCLTPMGASAKAGRVARSVWTPTRTQCGVPFRSVPVP